MNIQFILRGYPVGIKCTSWRLLSLQSLINVVNVLAIVQVEVVNGGFVELYKPSILMHLHLCVLGLNVEHFGFNLLKHDRHRSIKNWLVYRFMDLVAEEVVISVLHPLGRYDAFLRIVVPALVDTLSHHFGDWGTRITLTILYLLFP